MLTVGSLFSGIGGFDLGLERAGMRTVWFCEQDPFCQRVLAKHWPGVPCHPDVRALVADASGTGRRKDVRGAHGDEGADEGRSAPRPDVAGGRGEGDGAGEVVSVPVPFWTPEDGEYTVVARVDVLCGGFPCQDISVAGRGAGLDGDRSGLWSEYARLIRELRPRYVVVENVAALLARGFGRVLGDLAACGYDAEWDCIPASAVGAPHRRDRIWLVAYTDNPGCSERRRAVAVRSQLPPVECGGEACPYCAPDERCGVCAGDERRRALEDAERARRLGSQADSAGAESLGGAPSGPDGSGWWELEPDVGRVAHGVPARVDRLRSLGNALVPQIAELIGRRIVAWEGGLT